MKDYDYSSEGLYFITVNTEDRICLFGEIDQELILNDAGKIANECWMDIPKHFPNAVLHEHIVMPNHVHGIIELIENGSTYVGAENFLPLQSPNESLSTIDVGNIQPRRNEFQKMIPHSIGSIVKGFKIGVTKWFRNNAVVAVGVENFQPLPQRRQIWQRNYYEHIIRNEQSYQRITDYIINNPKNWKQDDFFN
jgi:REP element-mobilizing transposase RayT